MANSRIGYKMSLSAGFKLTSLLSNYIVIHIIFWSTIVNNLRLMEKLKKTIVFMLVKMLIEKQ